MSLTDLEASLVRAIARSRDTPFGAEARRHAHRAGGPKSTRPFPTLGDFELSAFPPLRRTRAILRASELTRQPIDLDDVDREHVAWVNETLELMASIADRFWGDVQPPIRVLFTDADDAPPLPFQSTFMLPGLRRLHPPPLRRTAPAAGAGDEDLRWLRPVWSTARRTPAYVAALDAQHRIRADPSLFRQLRDARDRLIAAPPSPLSGEIMTSLATRSIAHFVPPFDDPATPQATAIGALRGYNRLVHAALVAWFAGLEHYEALPSLDPGDEALTVDALDNRFSVTVTVRKQGQLGWRLHVYAPFEIDRDTPLDGLYLTTALSAKGIGQASSTDVTGFRLRELAEP